ncbi:MAG: peroxiredoxin-like family protein [Acidobacteriaceae bacterium]
MPPSLQEELDTITANTRILVQPERLEVSERAIGELFASGIEGRVSQAGQRAPEFLLPDANGKLVRSSDLLAIGPVVVNFFRGRWCPYCVTELERWRDLYPALRERKALLVSISPQTVRHNDFTVQQHSLPFPLLSDQGNALARQFGLAYTLPEYQQRYFRSIMVNIPYVNGDDSWELPLPATFAIGRSGDILFAEAHADFRVRPQPEEILSLL